MTGQNRVEAIPTLSFFPHLVDAGRATYELNVLHLPLSPLRPFPLQYRRNRIFQLLDKSNVLHTVTLT